MKKYLGVLVLLLSAAGAANTSGLEVGQVTPAHHPQHITGPDINTDVCPV